LRLLPWFRTEAYKRKALRLQTLEPGHEVVPAVGCEGEVEVVGVTVKAVVADGVSAHDETGKAG
jgi:hypothetical protein